MFFPKIFPSLLYGLLGAALARLPALCPVAEPHKMVLTGGALLALNRWEGGVFFTAGEATNWGFGSGTGARGAEPTKHPLNECKWIRWSGTLSLLLPFTVLLQYSILLFMIYSSICFSERWLLLASSFELPFRRKWKGEDNVLNSKSCHSSFPAMLVFILLITYQFRWFSHTPICQQSTLWVLICSQIASNNMLRKYIAVDAWALVRYSTCHYVLFLHFLCIYFLIFYNSKSFFRWFRTNDTKLSTW